MPPAARAALVEVGRIVNRHGVRGELRILPHNPASTILDALPPVVLRAPDGTCTAARLVAVRRHKRFVLARVAGVESVEAADALRGHAVCVGRDRLPPAGPDEVYHVDLIGCAVRTEDGTALGTVREVLSLASNDVCVVQGAREYLIPLIADVVVHLDPAAGELIIRPLPGLLDP
jgi:16S rRNA processing protein RimM